MSLTTVFKSVTNSVSTACSAIDLSFSATSTLISIGANKLESTKKNYEQTQPVIDAKNLAIKKIELSNELNEVKKQFNDNNELSKTYSKIFIDSKSVDDFLMLPQD